MAEVRATLSLGGFDDNFVAIIEDEWHCPICQLPLKEAVQTAVCGHRFCRQCLEEHFARQEHNQQLPSCPVDRNNLIRDKDIFPDKATDRRILSFIIKCPSEGCQWTGELRSKDNHLASCPLKAVACTNNNCHMTLPRKDLLEHMTITCTWRVVSCRHCDVSHAACHTEAHQSECRRYPLNCPNNCGFVIPREEIQAHVKKDCTMEVISCPYAAMGYATEVQRKMVETHLQSDMRLHLDLACTKFSDMQKELINTKEVLRNTQDELRITQEEFRNTQEELHNTQETTRKLGEKINTLENKPLRYQNLFTWKISGFHEMLTQAKSGQKSKVYSVPFYMGECGYKFRMCLYPNGIKSGKHKHLSLYVNVMKGEYDSILNWPFREKLTFSLIDQQENPYKKKDIIKSLTKEREEENWNARPEAEENHRKGFSEFVSHDEMNERRYLVNDTMFIQLKLFALQVPF